MDPKDRELLLKDLTGRLQYGVVCFAKWKEEAPNGTSGYVDELSTFLIDEFIAEETICELKPYLRPLSSMTAEEWEQYSEFENAITDYDADTRILAGTMVDWLNEKHFDYRGLIGKGLAIEVGPGKNPYLRTRVDEA